METTQEALENAQTEIPGTEPTQEASPEKKERKKKDLSGDFRYYAVENPFNKGITVKRFRETVGTPLGAIFCKLKAGTPEYEKYAEEDGSCLVTWFLQEARGASRAKQLASGVVPYVIHDEVIVQRSITVIDAPVEPPKQTRQKAEPKERKTREKKAKVQESSPVENSESFKFYEAPDEDEDTSEKDEPVGKFSFRKEALSYARKLGLSGKDADNSVKKIDGYWQVVQS